MATNSQKLNGLSGHSSASLLISTQSPTKSPLLNQNNRLISNQNGHCKNYRTIWEEKRERTVHALTEVVKIEKELGDISVDSLQSFKAELSSLTKLYSFLMVNILHYLIILIPFL
jgi:hypothetical protein